MTKCVIFFWGGGGGGGGGGGRRNTMQEKLGTCLYIHTCMYLVCVCFWVIESYHFGS